MNEFEFEDYSIEIDSDLIGKDFDDIDGLTLENWREPGDLQN